MNFLGMGTGELAVIAIVALIIFGPGKLPEVAGQVGKLLGQFRKVTGDLTSEFEQTAGLDEIKRTVQKEIAGVQSEVNAVTKGVKKDLSTTTKSATKSTAAKPATAKATTGSKTTTTTAGAKSVSSTVKASATAKKVDEPSEPPAPKAASKSDPLADLVALDAPTSGATIKTTAPAFQVEDALARARARRTQAGVSQPNA
jgi:Tat protein translocase TatB subunit